MEILFWAFEGFNLPFVGAYLVSRGLSNTSIGIIASINALMAILAPPLWGFVSDRVRSVRKVFIICMIGGMAAIWLIPLSSLFPQTATFIPLLVVLYALFWCFDNPLQSLMDSWLMQTIKPVPTIQYSNVRLWGSVGYAIVVSIAGAFYSRFSVQWMFLFYTVMAAIALIYALFLRSGSFQQKEVEHAATPHEKASPLLLIKNYRYVIFVLFVTLLYIPSSIFFTFQLQHFRHLGGNAGSLGFAMTLSCVGEVIGFLLAWPLSKRFKPMTRLLMASGVFMVRSLLYLLCRTPFQLGMVHMLQGTGNAIFLGGMAYFFDYYAPPSLKATSQTLGYAFSMGGATIAGSMIGGALVDKWSYPKLYFAELIFTVIVVGLFMLTLLPRKKKQPLPPDLEPAKQT